MAVASRRDEGLDVTPHSAALSANESAQGDQGSLQHLLEQKLREVVALSERIAELEGTIDALTRRQECILAEHSGKWTLAERHFWKSH